MNKIFTILIICFLSGATTLFAQDPAQELAKAKKDRERLIDLVISLEKDFGNTLRDYARLQNDYAKVLKKKDAPDHSAKVAELQKKLNQALERLKNQKAPPKNKQNHALLEQDIVNLSNELHRERQELLIARARVHRLKQLEKENKALQASSTKNAAALKAIQTEKGTLMGKLEKNMVELQKSEKARLVLVTRLNQLEQENLALKEKLTERDAQIARLRKIEAEHQKTLAASAELKKENDKLNTLVAEREKQLANLREHLAAEVKRTLDIPILIRAKDELQKKLKESEKNSGELQEKNNQLNLRKDELEKKIATVEESIATMRAQLAKNKSAIAAVAKLKTENQELKSEQDELQNTLEMAKAELVKSMGTRKRLEAQLAESQKVAIAAAKLKQMNDALLEEQDLLNNQLKNTENTLKASHQLTDELQTSVLDLTKEKVGLVDALSENETALEKLRTETVRKPEMDKAIATLEQEKEDLANQLVQREGDLKKTRSELGKLQITATVVQKELASLKREEAEIDPVRYALGGTEISQQQTRVLKQIREVLQLFPEARFEIVGHTCDIGKADANLELSQKRAKSLYDFLLSKNFPKDRLSHRGVGQTQPLVPNTNEANRQLNRRVVVEILD